MKRYIYIIIGIVAAAAIVILILFLIKNGVGSPSPTLNATSSTSGGSLPITGTTGVQGTGGTTTGAGTSSSTGAGALGLPTLASGTAETTGTTGQMTVENFGVLSAEPVLDYFIDPQNNITAIEPTGAVITISNGQTTVINSSTIDNIISASFSFDGKKIVASYGDPSNPQAGIFDVATQAWTALPGGIFSPQWSPINNYQIAYLVATNTGRLALATINAASLKTSPSVLVTLSATDLALQWPTKTEFILSDKPTWQNAGSVWAFNSQAGTLTALLYQTPGAEGIWSHDTAIPYGLLSFNNSNGQGNNLELQAISGNLPTQPLNFLTLPTKCAFNPEQMPIVASTTPASAATSTATSTKKTATPAKTNAPTSTPYLALYCGIPRGSSNFSSAHLPDDYNTMAVFTSDDIYKIDTATGDEQSLWSDNTQNVDVSDVKFFNNALFFVNRYDQKLYGLTFN